MHGEVVKLAIHVIDGEGHRSDVLGVVRGVPRPRHHGPSKWREIAVVNWGRSCRELGSWLSEGWTSASALSAFMSPAATADAPHWVPTLRNGMASGEASKAFTSDVPQELLVGVGVHQCDFGGWGL